MSMYATSHIAYEPTELNTANRRAMVGGEIHTPDPEAVARLKAIMAEQKAAGSPARQARLKAKTYGADNQTTEEIIMPKKQTLSDERVAELAQKRRETGATYAELAEGAGVHQSTLAKNIQAYEEGKRQSKPERESLTDEQVREIHRRYMAGETLRSLKQAFKTSNQTIYENWERLGLPKKSDLLKSGGELSVVSSEVPATNSELRIAGNELSALLTGLLGLDGAAVRGKVRINLDIEVML